MNSNDIQLCTGDGNTLIQKDELKKDYDRAVTELHRCGYGTSVIINVGWTEPVHNFIRLKSVLNQFELDIYDVMFSYCKTTEDILKVIDERDMELYQERTGLSDRLRKLVCDKDDSTAPYKTTQVSRNWYPMGEKVPDGGAPDGSTTYLDESGIIRVLPADYLRLNNFDLLLASGGDRSTGDILGHNVCVDEARGVITTTDGVKHVIDVTGVNGWYDTTATTQQRSVSFDVKYVIHYDEIDKPDEEFIDTIFGCYNVNDGLLNLASLRGCTTQVKFGGNLSSKSNEENQNKEEKPETKQDEQNIEQYTIPWKVMPIKRNWKGQVNEFRKLNSALNVIGCNAFANAFNNCQTWNDYMDTLSHVLWHNDDSNFVKDALNSENKQIDTIDIKNNWTGTIDEYLELTNLLSKEGLSPDNEIFNECTKYNEYKEALHVYLAGHVAHDIQNGIIDTSPIPILNIADIFKNISDHGFIYAPLVFGINQRRDPVIDAINTHIQLQRELNTLVSSYCMTHRCLPEMVKLPDGYSQHDYHLIRLIVLCSIYYTKSYPPVLDYHVETGIKETIQSLICDPCYYSNYTHVLYRFLIASHYLLDAAVDINSYKDVTGVNWRMIVDANIMSSLLMIDAYITNSISMRKEEKST